MIGNDSSLKEKPKLPILKHIIGTREISSTSSAQTFVSYVKILNISPNQLSPTPSAAATCIGHCADIFTKILLCLPPKSLLRFQCVSKQWHSVISNSDFRRLHSRTFHNCCMSLEFDALLLLFRSSKSNVKFIYFSRQNVKAMDSITTRLSINLFGKILGLHSSNGLLCIHFHLNGDDEFIVCNPTNNSYRLIPKCTIVEESSTFPSGIYICFDPLKSDHYKLVFICVDDEEDEYYFFIYSSEIEIWKEIELLPEISPSECDCTQDGIFWNGNLHCLDDSGSVSCFDLNMESFNLSVPSLPTLGERGDD